MNSAYNGRSAVMIRFLIMAGLVGLMVISPVVAGAADPEAKIPGIVYLVFAIDTEPYQIDPAKLEQIPEFGCFGYYDKVEQAMESSWRGCHTDSFGDSLRLTWFVMSHEAFGHMPDGSYTMVPDTLLRFRSSIEQFGDQIAWHY
ncbi:MAG: hypothetical protein PHR28_11315, partial [candidate division Zixibacteria bacterium]|nr:hypothetical protein [candidate division Zixibacteria bacterium]